MENENISFHHFFLTYPVYCFFYIYLFGSTIDNFNAYFIIKGDIGNIPIVDEI